MKRPPPEALPPREEIDVLVTLTAGPAWEVWRMRFVPADWTDEQIRDAFPEWDDKDLRDSGTDYWEITEIERMP